MRKILLAAAQFIFVSGPKQITKKCNRNVISLRIHVMPLLLISL
jgi:hypothetical protein